MSIVILVISVVIAPEIVKKLGEHYAEGWGQHEIRETKPDRTPQTHALAAVWTIDIAQIPAIVGPPTAGLIVAHKAYSNVFLTAYTVVIATGLVLFAYYKSRVKILRYAQRGRDVLGYRVSPLVIGGITFNVVAGVAAMLVIK
jgi:hypothetical protein